MPNLAISPGSRRSAAVELGKRLTVYKTWRDELLAVIREYRKWLAENEGQEPADEELLGRLIDILETDKVVLALVGEFSRGKTELLNGLLFGDFDRRLLPSSAGRTTMCPTELRYDDREGAHVRLLPIETRKTAITIAEYKRNGVHWHKTHILKPTSADELRQAFSEVTRTKRVHVREAQELGLLDPSSQDPAKPEVVRDTVEVPVWRHAIINHPHPLLRQGLVVLDTPGLNALGTEPELTLSTLPGADLVLFLLGADTGVTRTDLEIWNNYVSQHGTVRTSQHVVALNKVDILWDDLASEESIGRTIAQQVSEVARHLAIEPSQVFPVSAKHAIAALAKGDAHGVEKSGLPALEARLCDQVFQAKHEMIRRRVVFELSRRLDRSRSLLQKRLAGTENQLKDLKALGGRNADTLQQLVDRLRAEKERYDHERKAFEQMRRLLGRKAEGLFGHLAGVEQLILQTHNDMRGSWTTQGLREGVATFFAGASAILDRTKMAAADIQAVLNGLCERLHAEFRLGRISAAPLSLLPFFIELKKLEARAESFRNSAAVIVTEQHSVIERFFATLVAEARRLFLQTNDAARQWFREVGTQIFGEIRRHKTAIDRELESLRALSSNIDGVTEQIQALENAHQDIRNELDAIRTLHEKIERQDLW